MTLKTSLHCKVADVHQANILRWTLYLFQFFLVKVYDIIPAPLSSLTRSRVVHGHLWQCCRSLPKAPFFCVHRLPFQSAQSLEDRGLCLKYPSVHSTIRASVTPWACGTTHNDPCFLPWEPRIHDHADKRIIHLARDSSRSFVQQPLRSGERFDLSGSVFILPWWEAEQSGPGCTIPHPGVW